MCHVYHAYLFQCVRCLPSFPQAVHQFLEDSRFSKYQLPDDVLSWEAIPMTGTGKMDKKNVRKRLHDEGYVLPSLRSKSRL